MTEKQPTPPLDDELLSAYVDGELTDDERAQVETRLADDPQARQLVDELRTLSQQIQSLPAESIGEDLRTTIMQRAEREMLIGSETEKVLPQRETSSARRWTWVALAAAATLLVNLLLPSIQEDEQPVASAKPVQAETDDNELLEEPLAPAAESGVRAADEELLDQSESADVARAEPIADKLVASAPAAAGATTGDEVNRQPRMLASNVPAPPAGAVSRSRSTKLSNQPSLASQTVDLSGLTCEVHISLGDGQKSVEQVDRYLVQNRIVQPEEFENSGFGAESSSSEETAGEQFAKLDKGTEDSAQVFLIEAPLENIAGTLEDCNIDTFNCPTIRVVDKRKQQTPPVEQLLKWQRGPDEARFDEVVEQFALRQQMQVPQNQLNFRQATSLADRARLQQRKAMAVEQKRMALSASDSELTEGDEPPMRVLFVLQQAADLRKPLKIETKTESLEKR